MKQIVVNTLLALIITTSLGGVFFSVPMPTHVAYAQTNDCNDSSWWMYPVCQVGSTVSDLGSKIVDFFDPWNLMAIIGSLFLQTAGLILWTMGMLLNAVISYLVISMGTITNSIIGIPLAWAVIRDVSNIIFVFALLVIGIATILGVERYGYRQLLVRLIIAALLINFSLFFTKVVIDVSNLFAIEMYQRIVTSDPSNPTGDGCGDLSDDEVFGTTDGGAAQRNCLQRGISGVFMNQTWVVTIYDAAGISNVFSNVETTPPGGGVTGATAEQARSEESTRGQNKQIFYLSVFGTILFLVTAFVLGAMALMLVARFVILVFLMIFSPIAFAAMVLPQTRKMSEDWWHALFKQAFFAPAMLLMIWISVIVLNSLAPIFKIGGGATAFSFSACFSGSTGSVPIFVNFAIVIGLMILSLVVSQKIGAYGASGAVSVGKKWSRKAGGYVKGGAWNTTRFAGRTTARAVSGGAGAIGRTAVGGFAYKGLQSAKLQENRGKGGFRGFVARTKAGAYEKLSDASFESNTLRKKAGLKEKKGGFKTRVDNIRKREEEKMKDVGEPIYKKEDREQQAQIRERTLAAQKEQAQEQTKYLDTMKEAREKEQEIEEKKKAGYDERSLNRLRQEKDAIVSKASDYRKNANDFGKTIKQLNADMQTLDNVVKFRGAERKETYAKTNERGALLPIVRRAHDAAYKEAATNIRKSKTNLQQVGDILKKMQSEDDGSSVVTPTPPPAPPTPPTT